MTSSHRDYIVHFEEGLIAKGVLPQRLVFVGQEITCITTPLFKFLEGFSAYPVNAVFDYFYDPVLELVDSEDLRPV